MTVDGWTYDGEVEDRKVFHYAVRDGERVSIHHTGREFMTLEAFTAHVRIGFRAPPSVLTIYGNGDRCTYAWRNDTVVKAAQVTA